MNDFDSVAFISLMKIVTTLCIIAFIIAVWPADGDDD
jgi:hypothetical protein